MPGVHALDGLPRAASTLRRASCLAPRWYCSPVRASSYPVSANSTEPLLSLASISEDLKLNEPPPPRLPERLRLDRTRTWFQVVCIDASTSVQQGKPPVVQGSDYVERALATWYRCSPLNSPYDLYLCAFTDLALLVARLWKAIGADRCDPDLVQVRGSVRVWTCG